MYNPDVVHETALRNLLQRRGYPDLDAVWEKGELALVLHLLRRAIGKIPESDCQRIRRLGRDGLAALAEDLLDFRATSDLTVWLERHLHTRHA